MVRLGWIRVCDALRECDRLWYYIWYWQSVVCKEEMRGRNVLHVGSEESVSGYRNEARVGCDARRKRVSALKDAEKFVM